MSILAAVRALAVGVHSLGYRVSHGIEGQSWEWSQMHAGAQLEGLAAGGPAV